MTLKSIAKTGFEYMRAFAIIGIALMIGIAMQTYLSISIPGSILGMAVLFIGLASGLVPAHWVQPGASLFIRHMIFLFVPISVGLMVHFDLLLDNLVAIIASVVAGSVLVLIIMSYCIEKLVSRDS
ncbi:CidA/LrgA family protein [Vibrio astriarenae]|uniref:CidA/LrgA family protein n=1 Tax=Vibrio astriarenae TaxID=1481923 RepID=UPI0030B82B85